MHTGTASPLPLPDILGFDDPLPVAVLDHITFELKRGIAPQPIKSPFDDPEVQRFRFRYPPIMNHISI
jgi:hypothetical protein